ncbi:MAG: non-hydrolyzing UDP-N-acetylglucosamine 2-epimerase [Bacteroidota bacterium]
MRPSSKKILIVVGTRPNFIKITRFKQLAGNFPSLEIKIAHTGQHYDAGMSDVFFNQFQLNPDYFLHVSGGSACSQTAAVIEKLEQLLLGDFKADLVLVVGDVNSTLAAAIAAVKCGIPVGHIESGLRSFDRSMPEEINRVATDGITDYFFVTEKSGTENLFREGKNEKNIFFVGNTMIDTIVAFDKEIKKSDVIQRLGIHHPFVLMTMHRPATVDHPEGLAALLDAVKIIPEKYHVVFPVHPRTRSNISRFGIQSLFEITEPLDYFAFQKLVLESAFIITDSGGIQEESTFRQIPCLTLRPNTERPVTVTEGTNTLLPFDKNNLKKYIRQIESGNYKKGKVPVYWDGKSTERILEIINKVV